MSDELKGLLAIVVTSGAVVSGAVYYMGEEVVSVPPTLARLSEADRALMPQEVDLSAWFATSGTEAQPPDRDPWYPDARVVNASDYGAMPDDGIDDTDAIQAAYDDVCQYIPWDMTPRAPTDPHGFIVLDPGVYTVTQIHPCAGTTLHGYGATLQRPPWGWWVSLYGEDGAASEAGSSRARIINGWGYHPRIEYRWRGEYPSPPMRFVGITLDGNVASGGFPDWQDYQFWAAHLAVFDSTGEGGTQEAIGNLNVELIDVTAKESPSDCVAAVSNVNLTVRRYTTDGCFRGAITSLGNNNYIDVEEAYLGGPPSNHRGFDREPQGSSVGYDLRTGEDWTLAQRSAREYWHVRDVVIAAAGLDIASSVIPEPSNTAQGGHLIFERIYVLRPHTLNLIQYGANVDGSPVLEIRDSYIRAGVIDGLAWPGPDGAYWALSNVRWSARVRIQDSTLVLAAPPDALLGAYFEGRPPTAKLYPTMLALDQTTIASRQWPDTRLELVDVDFELDPAWASSAYRDRVVLRAVSQNGNAGQGHTLLWRGGGVSDGYDWGLYQFHGGRAVLDAKVKAIHACSYNPPGWTYSIERSGDALSADAVTCPGGVGEWLE